MSPPEKRSCEPHATQLSLRLSLEAKFWKFIRKKVLGKYKDFRSLQNLVKVVSYFVENYLKLAAEWFLQYLM